MPLQIKDASPSSIATLNRWAMNRENEINTQKKQIQQLQQLLTNLYKNIAPGALPIK